MAAPNGTVDIWNFVDKVTGTTVKKWLRDSWSRNRIVELQDEMAAISSGKTLPYGYCTTAAATVAKTVTVAPAVTAMNTGMTIAVKFQYANTGSNPTLNVNGLGAKAIKRYGTTAAGTSAAANWNANSVVLLCYDGTYWMMVDYNNTTYSSMSVAEYQAGTSTSARLITPARLKAAILYHVGEKFADISGTLPSNSSPSTAVSYPDGFTQSNCIITGFMVQQTSGDWQAGDVGASIILGSTGYSTSCTASGLYGRPWKAALMRTDI